MKYHLTVFYKMVYQIEYQFSKRGKQKLAGEISWNRAARRDAQQSKHMIHEIKVLDPKRHAGATFFAPALLEEVDKIFVDIA